MEDRIEYVKMEAIHFKTCVGKVTSVLRCSSTNYENLGENFFVPCILHVCYSVYRYQPLDVFGRITRKRTAFAFISVTRGVQIFHISRSHFRILGCGHVAELSISGDMVPGISALRFCNFLQLTEQIDLSML